MNTNINRTIMTSSKIYLSLEEDSEGSKQQQAAQQSNNSAQTEQTAINEGLGLEGTMQFLAMQNQVKFVSIAKTLAGTLNNGVYQFVFDDKEVTIYNKDGVIKSQVISDGEVDFNSIYKKIEIINPIRPDNQPTSGTVNGELDEWIEQGGTGDCWLIAGILALNSTDEGKKIIKESITANSDGSVTVTFKGLGVSYTISAAEIRLHDTDSNKNDAYSNGDNDMLAFELAVEKLKKDIKSGKVKLDVDSESYEGYNNNDFSIEGGFSQQIVYFLTGKVSETHCVDTDSAKNDAEARKLLSKGLPVEEVLEVLQQASENQPVVLNFGVYYGVKRAQCVDGRVFNLDVTSGGHALAITNIDAEKRTVTIVNPWDSTKEYTLSWEEFAKMGIGMLSVAQLDKAEQPEEPVEPNGPVIEPDNTDDVDGNQPVNPNVDISGLEKWSDSIDFTKIPGLNDQIKGFPSNFDKFFESIEVIRDQLVEYVKKELKNASEKYGRNVKIDEDIINRCLNMLITQNTSISISNPETNNLKRMVTDIMSAIDETIKQSLFITIYNSHDPFLVDNISFTKDCGLSPFEDGYLLNTASYYLNDEERELQSLMIRLKLSEDPNFMNEPVRIDYITAQKEVDLMCKHLSKFLKQQGFSETEIEKILADAKDETFDKNQIFRTTDEATFIKNFIKRVMRLAGLDSSGRKMPDSIKNIRRYSI